MEDKNKLIEEITNLKNENSKQVDHISNLEQEISEIQESITNIINGCNCRCYNGGS